ncbi:cytochrome c oxidase assembly protein subunit 15 [Aliiroseovarius sediminilitoris]|uniref:Heme A synthase n=1 Tax=Aliiroseovarius sediminilitoris TaxID=1173584 RepID=A0A1I0PTK9_9RHOB|nr:heme A synthase [Aliiroseovarius sediminilitoris]SEW17732.1 cytochrome c oxidase assembly protein subunit 15 [Aliiroseovarius sediminilitoris]
MSKPRSIFEEVSDDTTTSRAAPEAGVIERGSGGGAARGAVRLWLMLLFALVAAMVVVGGLTRLTDSGLSITEWAPFTGAMPPMNDADWAAEFGKYQQIPEFKLQNSGMDLVDFKSIYWWEWGHRQLGRFIGLVWAVGFFGFLAARKIPNGWTGRLLLLGALGGLQGAIGWWMVSSGLSGDRVDVASYRLAIHLGLAFVILGLIAWYVLMLGRKEASLMAARRGRETKLFGMGTGLMHLALLQIVLGALVAGIDAGRSFVDWPWMAGQFFPPDALGLSPVWRNFFENAGLVQFMHRITGYLLAIFAIVVWRASRRSGNQMVRSGFTLATLMVLGQVVLGITTVLQASPLHVAITHQVGAILTWVLILNARFMAGYPAEQSIRK